MRFQVVKPWYGESGTLWYIVDTAEPESEQPAVVLSERSKEAAEETARCLNMAGVVIY
jgi:hypothetical protein